MKNNQQNHIGAFMCLTQVKAVLFTVISATSYYRFLDSTPFKIARGIYGQQINYMHTKLQAYPESIWRVRQHVHNKEVCEVSIPWIHSSWPKFPAAPKARFSISSILRNSLQYHAISCNIMQYHAISYPKLSQHAISCNIVSKVIRANIISHWGTVLNEGIPSGLHLIGLLRSCDLVWAHSRSYVRWY